MLKVGCSHDCVAFELAGIESTWLATLSDDESMGSVEHSLFSGEGHERIMLSIGKEKDSSATTVLILKPKWCCTCRLRPWKQDGQITET